MLSRNLGDHSAKPMPNDVQKYTWSQFVAAVLALLPVDSQRIGPVQPYILLLIRQAVIECQTMVPWLRTGHENLYQGGDFVGEGWASRAALPPQARIKDAYLVAYDRDCTGKPQSPAHCKRYKLHDFPWSRRMGLINAGVPTNGGHGYISFDGQSETFYVYPAVRDTYNVSIFWDGLKVNFQPNEMTPFDEQMTLVVADYVKSRTSREIDKDIPLGDSYGASYKTGRRLMFLNLKDRAQTNQEIT